MQDTSKRAKKALFLYCNTHNGAIDGDKLSFKSYSLAESNLRMSL